MPQPSESAAHNVDHSLADRRPPVRALVALFIVFGVVAAVLFARSVYSSRASAVSPPARTQVATPAGTFAGTPAGVPPPYAPQAKMSVEQLLASAATPRGS